MTFGNIVLVFIATQKNVFPFLNETKNENCNTATEDIKDFVPNEIFRAYQDEKVDHLVDLTANCTTFLFVLHIEQQGHFVDHIHVLAVLEKLILGFISLRFAVLQQENTIFTHGKADRNEGGRVWMKIYRVSRGQ